MVGHEPEILHLDVPEVPVRDDLEPWVDHVHLHDQARRDSWGERDRHGQWARGGGLRTNENFALGWSTVFIAWKIQIGCKRSRYMYLLTLIYIKNLIYYRYFFHFFICLHFFDSTSDRKCNANHVALASTTPESLAGSYNSVAAWASARSHGSLPFKLNQQSLVSDANKKNEKLHRKHITNATMDSLWVNGSRNVASKPNDNVQFTGNSQSLVITKNERH